jgi:hypothetical protein
MQGQVLSGINLGFPKLSQSAGQITHVLLTRSPLEHPQRGLSARLACVKHAASVRPEPGSNSPKKIQTLTTKQKPTIKRQSQNHCKTTNPTPKNRERSTGKQTNQFIDYHTLLSSQRSGAHQRRQPVRVVASGARPTLASRVVANKSRPWCWPSRALDHPGFGSGASRDAVDLHPIVEEERESPGAGSPLSACSPPRPAQRT